LIRYTFSITIIIVMKNAGYCKTVPASGYQSRFDFVPTFSNQGLLKKFQSRIDCKIKITIRLKISNQGLIDLPSEVCSQTGFSTKVCLKNFNQGSIVKSKSRSG
jgi:hypothetical protein